MGLTSLIFGARSPNNEEAFKRMRAPVRGTLAINGFSFEEKISNGHFYMERGVGRPIVFCPGLFGCIDNVAELGLALSERYRFIVSYLPVYDLPLGHCSVPILADHLRAFVEELGLEEAVFIGSSMGGGTLLHYALKGYDGIKGLVLCGSSGLSTLPIQKGFFRRKDPAFVKSTIEEIFFDPTVPSENLQKEVYDALQNYGVVLRTIRFTKSTVRDQLHQELHKIRPPCLLVWGRHDVIVPPDAGQLFDELLPNSSLHFLEDCGHVPTQEKPEQVLSLVQNFLRKIDYH